MNVNSIRSSSVDPWSSHDDDTQPPAAPAAPALPRDASAIPELPDVHAGLLAKAAQTAQATPRPSTPQAASTPHPLLATGLKAADVAPIVDASKTHVIMARLDAFLQSATPTYHIPGEGDVAVAVPFRLWKPPAGAYPDQEAVVSNNVGERDRIGKAAGLSEGDILLVHVARGTPQSIQRLTQALIDRGKLPSAHPSTQSLVDRVRRMMCDYGIGLDCAGYAQQAFLAANGVNRSVAGFGPADSESLALVGNGRFARTSPSSATAGDIIALNPPKGQSFGHRVIVYERHVITPAEIDHLTGTAADLARVRNGQVSVLEVDSSWGSGGVPEWGGVKRMQWVYDAASDQWGSIRGGAIEFTRTGLPYDGEHSLLGVFHFRGAQSTGGGQ